MSGGGQEVGAERLRNPAPLVELEEVRKEYRVAGETSVILAGCSLRIAAGEFACILGPSGSGKTTLLNLIGGLDTPTSGSVRIAGDDLSHLDRWGLTEVRRRKVGFVFQFYNLIPTLTARENVMCALELLGTPGKEAARRSDEMLSAVGLAGKESLFPAQLSGGQQQRVAVARALVKKPPLLLADEPTGNLDRLRSADVMTLIESLRRDLGTTLVVVTHDPAVAAHAEMLVRIDEGSVTVSRNHPSDGAAS